MQSQDANTLFSAGFGRRLKTWLRSSMSDARLTWLAVCAIHKDELDSLELEKVANEFINIKPGREKVFGRF